MYGGREIQKLRFFRTLKKNNIVIERPKKIIITQLQKESDKIHVEVIGTGINRYICIGNIRPISRCDIAAGLYIPV